MSSEADVAAFVDWADGVLGGLNALINNAGIIRDGLLVKRDRETGEIKKLPKEQWDAVIGVNLTGAALLARDTVAKIVAAHAPAQAHGASRGVVVNISSVSRYGLRGQSNYSAAKAGLAAVTRTWALEWGPMGIRCGGVAPGMVETPMTRGMNQKARDALVGRGARGANRRAGGSLARREIRPRVRLLQRQDDRRRRRPDRVIPRRPARGSLPRGRLR